MKPYLAVAVIALACAVSGLGCSARSTSSTGPRKITLLKPSNQTLIRGGTHKIEITVHKENIDSDVSVRFDNLPEGVDVVEMDMNSADNECVANYTLSASNSAVLVSEQVVRVTAEGPDGLSVTQSFALTVSP